MFRAAMLVAAALAVVSPVQAQAPAKDWSRTIVSMPEGGFRMGNPAAPNRLIEYGSFTCSHCADFAEKAEPVLIERYVKSGKLSFEYRPFVRDPFDMAAATLARCAPADRFFVVKKRIFDSRGAWIAKAQAIPQDQAREINAMPVQQQLTRLASLSGVDAASGLPAATVKQCLATKLNTDKLVAMRQQAMNKHGLEGTPTFILNGKTLDAHDWSRLEPLLPSPGG